MERVTSLNQLVVRLNECQGKEFQDIINFIDLTSSELSNYQFWDSTQYTRNCVERNEQYELILLCWEPGQHTPIHCHGGEECWVQLLQGEMAESRFVFDEDGKLINQGVERLAKNNLTHINDAQGFHSLSNIGLGRAMSLHLYAKPIVKCRVFNTEEKKFEETPLSDYSLKGVRMSVAV